MATTFPTTIDDFTNPSASDQVGVEVGGRTHSEFHTDTNDAIEAIEAKVGVNGSAVTTSHDYKLSGVTGSDKAVSLTGTETLSGKTLTAPKFVDGGFIADANGNELIVMDTVASSVNQIKVANAATGGNPAITAEGDDTNVGIDINTKGTGTVNVRGNSTQSGEIRIYEDTDNGTNYTALKVGSQSADITYTLPTTVASAGQFLSDAAGNGTLSWASVGSAVTATVSLSSADILALHTTPIVLVAAQGAGTVILVENCVYSMTAGTQYGSSGTLNVHYASDTEDLLSSSDETITNPSNTINAVFPVSGGGTEVKLSAGINKNVVLENDSAAFTAGTGTLKVFVTYRVITL